MSLRPQTPAIKRRKGGEKQDQRTRTEFQNDRVSTLGPRNPSGLLHIGHQEVISRASVTLIGESFERKIGKGSERSREKAHRAASEEPRKASVGG